MIDSEPGGQTLFLFVSLTGIVIYAFLTLIFSLIYSFAKSYESVVPRLDDDDLEEALNQGDKTLPHAQSLLNLRKDKQSFGHRIRTIKNFAFILLVWVFSSLVYAILLRVIPANMVWLVIVLSIIMLMVLLFVIMSFMGTFPERVAQRDPLNFANRYYGVFSILDAVTQPISCLSEKISHSLLRENDINPNESDILISEQDLKDLIEQRAAEEEVKYEQTLIENIFDFGDKTVADSMTHRMDVVAVDNTIGIDALVEEFRAEGYSRLPVYEETIDQIVGIVHSKDILLFAATEPNKEFKIEQFIRDIPYTPESKSLSSLFVQMQEESLHMAVVIDEYGGTAGIITMEDVLEELVGQIEDEYDEAEVDIIKVGDSNWTVNAWLSLEELEENLAVKLPKDEHDTVAGFVLSLLDRIPEENERPEVRYGDYIFQVETMDGKRIEKLNVKLSPQPMAVNNISPS